MLGTEDTERDGLAASSASSEPAQSTGQDAAKGPSGTRVDRARVATWASKAPSKSRTACPWGARETTAGGRGPGSRPNRRVLAPKPGQNTTTALWPPRTSQLSLNSRAHGYPGRKRLGWGSFRCEGPLKSRRRPHGRTSMLPPLCEGRTRSCHRKQNSRRAHNELRTAARHGKRCSKWKQSANGFSRSLGPRRR